jgi:hypothetical protein
MMLGRVTTTDHDDMMMASNILFVLFICFWLGHFLFHAKVEYTRLYSAKQTNRQNYYLYQHLIYNCIVSEYPPCSLFPSPRISAG